MSPSLIHVVPEGVGHLLPCTLVISVGSQTIRNNLSNQNVVHKVSDKRFQVISLRSDVHRVSDKHFLISEIIVYRLSTHTYD